MIVAFYGLYIIINPATWSWTWFLIAVVMNLLQYLRRREVDDAITRALDRADDDTPRWRGPF